jgi:hypothetical protein
VAFRPQPGFLVSLLLGYISGNRKRCEEERISADKDKGIVGSASEKERRELVVGLLDELSKQYLPRSVWLAEGSRKKVGNFLRMSEELCSEFSAEDRGAGLPAGQTQHGEAREQEAEAAQNRGRVRSRNRAWRAPQAAVAQAPCRLAEILP